MTSAATGPAARHALAARLDTALGGLETPPSTPTYVVDVDAFDTNAADLARRAAGTPIRVATKSLRVPALVERALTAPGFHGVLAYSLREALWLRARGIADDLLMGYPTVDRTALATLTRDPEAAATITLMVDDVAISTSSTPPAPGTSPCGSPSTWTPGCGSARPTSAPSARRCTTPARSSTSPAPSSTVRGSPWSG